MAFFSTLVFDIFHFRDKDSDFISQVLISWRLQIDCSELIIFEDSDIASHSSNKIMGYFFQAALEH